MPSSDDHEQLPAISTADDISIHGHAVVHLAGKRNKELLERVAKWLDADDKRFRHFAHECLLAAFTDEGRHTLWERWTNGPPEEDRLSLAITLLRFGEWRVEPYLEKVAKAADGVDSVVAAYAIYSREKADLFPKLFRVSRNMPLDRPASKPKLIGLKLIRSIVESGNDEAKRGMMIQIYNAGGDYSFDAAHYEDVTNQAIEWIEKEVADWQQKMSSLSNYPTKVSREENGSDR